MMAGWYFAFTSFSTGAEAAALKTWTEGTVPGFVLPAADGPEVALETHRGRIVLVHFFATWCEPCRDELPALQRLSQRADPATLVVLAISVAEVEQRIRRFFATMPVTFPVLLDRDRAVAKAWSIATLPSTIVLDADLKPRLVVEADYAWDGVEPKALIAMLGTPAPVTDSKQSSREPRP